MIQDEIFTETSLCGEIKNVEGHIDPEFLKSVEELMEKHKVNMVHLYWKKF